MSTISHDQRIAPDRWTTLLQLREVWYSVAVSMMWVAVAITAVWGPDFVSSSSPTNHTTIPSGIFVAIFASIGTWAIAKYGFCRADAP